MKKYIKKGSSDRLSSHKFFRASTKGSFNISYMLVVHFANYAYSHTTSAIKLRNILYVRVYDYNLIEERISLPTNSNNFNKVRLLLKEKKTQISIL